MFFYHVDTQTVLGGEAVVATDGAHGFAAVPGHMLATPRAVGQNLPAARHRADRGATGRTCRDNAHSEAHR